MDLKVQRRVGNKNVAKSKNLRSFSRNSFPLALSVRQTLLKLNSRGSYQSSEGEIIFRLCLFTFSIKREFRPRPYISVFVWKLRFFSPVWPTVHIYSVKTINLFLKKRRPLVYARKDENGGFRIRWCNTSFTTSITHVLWGMLSYFH